jgi:hypothetical protein
VRSATTIAIFQTSMRFLKAVAVHKTHVLTDR